MNKKSLLPPLNSDNNDEKSVPTNLSLKRILTLIRSNQDINKPRIAGRTILFEAETLEQIRLLIRAGANVNVADYNGFTPLHETKNSKHIKALIDAGANVNAQNIYGSTPLHYATSLKQIQILISAGANVNIADRNGFTPLHGAKDHEQTKALIDAGADVNAQNIYGATPLHYATSSKQIQILISAGANVCLFDNSGITPLMEHLQMAYANPTYLDNIIALIPQDYSTLPQHIKLKQDNLLHEFRKQLNDKEESIKSPDYTINKFHDVCCSIDKNRETLLMKYLKLLLSDSFFLSRVLYLVRQDYSELPQDVKAKQDEMLYSYRQQFDNSENINLFFCRENRNDPNTRPEYIWNI